MCSDPYCIKAAVVAVTAVIFALAYTALYASVRIIHYNTSSRNSGINIIDF